MHILLFPFAAYQSAQILCIFNFFFYFAKVTCIDKYKKYTYNLSEFINYTSQ